MYTLHFRPVFWNVALAALLTAGCAEGADESYADVQDATMATVEAEAMVEDAEGVPVATVAQTLTPGAEPETDRQLRRTAQLRVRASDHARAVAAAREQIADADGAFVADESSQRYDDSVETTLTVRVPSAQFEALMEALTALPGEVESRSISVDDVTREVADVSARLETKRLAEAQLRELLGRAGSVEDVLAVQTRLQTVREEIESTEAQLRVLRDQVSLSTIALTLFESSATGITAGPGFFAKAGRAIADGWDGAVAFVLALLTLWPFLLGLAALVWAARRWRRRRASV